MNSRAEERLKRRKRSWVVKRALVLIAIVAAIVTASYVSRGYWALGAEPLLTAIGSILIADSYERRWKK